MCLTYGPLNHIHIHADISASKILSSVCACIHSRYVVEPVDSSATRYTACSQPFTCHASTRRDRVHETKCLPRCSTANLDFLNCAGSQHR